MQHHHLEHDMHPLSRRVLKSQDCKLSGFGACSPHLAQTTNNNQNGTAREKSAVVPVDLTKASSADTPLTNGNDARIVIREFDYEDRYFAVCTADKSLFGYGIFDGQTGGYAAKFFSEELVSELLDQAALFKLQTQLVKRFLLRIFRESDDAYARLTSIQQAVQDREELRRIFLRSPSPRTPTPTSQPGARATNLNAPQQQTKLDLLEFYQTLPEQARKYEHAEARLRDGSSCVVCILAHGKLYTATCGTARAVLCRVKAGKGLDVVQLSPNHRLSNDDERLRVYETGALISMPSGSSDSNKTLASKTDETLSILLDPTRMLGNIALKVFFTEYPGLEQCRQSPLSSEPEVGLHTLTPSSSDPKKSFDAGFLLLFTDRLEKAVRHSGLLQISLDPDDDRKASESINELLCYMVSEEMNQHATLDRVARAVVGRVAHAMRQRKLSHENSAAGTAIADVVLSTDDDTSISLLIRNLRHPLPLAANLNSTQYDFLQANDGLPAPHGNTKVSPKHRATVKSSSSFTADKKPTIYDNIVTQSDQFMQHAASMSDISDAVMEEVIEEQQQLEQPGTPTRNTTISSLTSDDEADRTPWSLFSSAEDVSMRSVNSSNSTQPDAASSGAGTAVGQPQHKRITAYTNFDGYVSQLRTNGDAGGGGGVGGEPDLSSFLRAL